MSNKIVERISKECGVSNLLKILSEKISATDLQTILLETYRRRSSKLLPADLMRQYERNRFVQKVSLSPDEIWKFNQLVSRTLPEFYEMVELSPLAPFGVNSAMGKVDQNNAVTTIRNTEICSDNTNVLALECAVRRKKFLRKNTRAKDKVCLASSHRVVRSQLFEESVAFSHFQLLGLTTAGRDQGSFGFEIDSLKEHLNFYIRLLKETNHQGYSFDKVRIVFTAFNEIRQIAVKSLIQNYKLSQPKISFQMDQKRQGGRGYYKEVGFQIWVSKAADQDYLIVDGGFTDWTQKLLANKKERLLISGMGVERFMICFSL
jgi:hypothetical protein